MAKLHISTSMPKNGAHPNNRGRSQTAAQQDARRNNANNGACSGAGQNNRNRRTQPRTTQNRNSNSTASTTVVGNAIDQTIEDASIAHEQANPDFISMLTLTKSRKPARGGNKAGEFHQNYKNWYDRYRKFVMYDASNREELAAHFNGEAVICIPGVNQWFIEYISKRHGSKAHHQSALTALKHYLRYDPVEANSLVVTTKGVSICIL